MDNQNSNSNTIIKKAGLITVISLILGFLFNYLFIIKIPGIAFPIYIVLIIAGLFAILNFFKKQINKDVLWLLIPLIFFSTMVFIRSSWSLTFFNIIASLLLLLIIAKITLDGKIKNFFIKDYIKIFFLPFKFIHPLFLTLKDLFTIHITNKNQKTFLQITKGILMAIPVLFIFLLLFYSADLIFQKYVSDIINIKIKPEIIFRSTLILIATLFYIGAYSYSLKKKENQIADQQNNKNYTLGHIENSILLGSVNVLFLTFILIQLTYLFGGQNNISAQGFTYAEYARRGFFELITVAIVSLILLLTTEKFIVKKNTNHSIGFKLLSTALVVQVIVTMASAFTRLSLYEEAYGFTSLRLYSHAFICFLAIVFCLLLYKIYKDKRENAFAFRVFISTILFLAAMNLFNPDAFIAQRNIDRFTVTGKLDTQYLSRLSEDALPYTIKILNTPNDDVRKSFARDLYWQYYIRYDLIYSPSANWQSFNISRMKAYEIFKSKLNEIEPYKDYKQETRD